MEFQEAFLFDPVRPDLWHGDQAEWTRRANLYMAEKLRELREKRAAMNLTPGASSDLDVVLSGTAGDSGTCVDGVLEMESDRKALIEEIRNAQRKDVRTGLGEL